MSTLDLSQNPKLGDNALASCASFVKMQQKPRSMRTLKMAGCRCVFCTKEKG
jgi:hypothetical protein